PKQQIAIDSIDFTTLKEPQKVNRDLMNVETKLGRIMIPPACSFKEMRDINDDSFVISANSNLYSFEPSNRDGIVEMTELFINAPYLWGGKTPFGVDCSGLTQSVYKMAGIQLKRDASQQATQGEVLNFLEEALPGDLAFFDNEEGHITHVGIILADNEIIHASGKVRIDKIDHQGIYNIELGKYTHQLRLIKRML
ncbi:MAG: hydrolase Nlp/P60, partial [Bacteroidales bacterium]|nr:hydrolase Nlp/P60 [Bacteroidales bacterium]